MFQKVLGVKALFSKGPCGEGGQSPTNANLLPYLFTEGVQVFLKLGIGYGLALGLGG